MAGILVIRESIHLSREAGVMSPNCSSVNRRRETSDHMVIVEFHQRSAPFKVGGVTNL
jgi:hypothetical protein